jgi:hypothetical protein
MLWLLLELPLSLNNHTSSSLLSTVQAYGELFASVLTGGACKDERDERLFTEGLEDQSKRMHTCAENPVTVCDSTP